MSDITRSEAIKTLKEHLSHWERLLQEHICEEQEGIDTISALKLAIASLETDEAYQLEYERTTKNDLGIDCISRAKAIEEADKLCLETGYDNEKVIEMLNELSSVTPQEPRWIPVREKLPEEYTYTLWCATSGEVRSDYFNGKYWQEAKKYCYEVVAWMPLPNPYREVKE